MGGRKTASEEIDMPNNREKTHMCRTYTVQHLAPEEEIPGLELLPKVLTEQTLALRFPGRICKTIHAPIYVYNTAYAPRHSKCRIFGTHTWTLRTKQLPAPLHWLPLLHFAARALQPPDAGVVGLLGNGKLQMKRSFTKYSGMFDIQ